MGTVWSATDEFLRRPVAVKQMRLPADLPDGEAAELRERALREARAIARLTHPNVVTLYDVVREAGEPWVIMELVPSRSLSAHIERYGPLDDRQLAMIADCVAAALEAAHRAEIIHRDIKPSNVLVGDGVVKLSDFGIARNRAEPTITAVGIMLGTPAYIAPEIVVGDGVGAAADLWSLGATLFAASEGHPPYGTGDPLATITAVANDPPPAPARSGTLGEIISGLMVKDPELRMPLVEVRSKLRPLLAPGPWPFEALSDAELPTVRSPLPAAPPPSAPGQGHAAPARAQPAPPARPAPARPIPPPRPSGPQALASEPGPLPFATYEPASRGRRPWAPVLLGLTATVVFLVAATGAFGLVRTAAQQPLLPGEPALSSLPLVRYTDAAADQAAPASGAFMASVPQGWTVYKSQQPDPGGGEAVDFVSPDALYRVAVQRYAESTDDYLNKLPTLAPGVRVTRNQPCRGDRFVAYTSTDPGISGSEGPALVRSTTTVVMARGTGLWVLGVTVPGTGAASGRALLNKLLPGFSPGTGCRPS